MAPCLLDCPLLCHPHPVLDLRERLLDGIEIGRVWGQEPQSCAGVFDDLARGLGFVASQIVGDDDVAGPQRRNQLLLDISAEALAIDGPIEDARRGEPVTAKRRQEGHGAPAAMRGIATQSLALGSPTAQGRHVGLDPGLVDEHQPFGVEAALPGFPALAPPDYVATRLLIGAQAFF